MKSCVVILFQPHLSPWTGRQWSCLSTRPFNLTLEPSLALPSSTCSVPARVRTLAFVPACHKKMHKWGKFDSPPCCNCCFCCAVDQQKLQGVMMELAAYCSNNQASLSSAVPSRPVPGAACCAQFSGEEHSLFHKYILYIIIGLSITLPHRYQGPAKTVTCATIACSSF